MSGLTKTVQLIGDPKYRHDMQFNVIIRKDAKGSPFAGVIAKAALTPQLTITKKMAAVYILPEYIAGIKQKRLKKDSKEKHPRT